MHDFFFDFIGQWYWAEQERGGALPLMPGYTQAAQDLFQSREALYACLDGLSRQAYCAHEEARNHMAVLAENAAFLSGLRAGLRLSLRL